MASLFIKDHETAARVDRIARRLGTTKTDTVRQALAALEDRLGPEPAPPRPGLAERMAAWRKTNPLPPPSGLKADKAFFDRMWGEAE